MLENSRELLQIALGDTAPWQVEKVAFTPTESQEQELHLHLDFPAGSEFLDDQGIPCKAYDTQHHTWRHLNFFQHTCYLHAYVPRIRTSGGEIKKITPPWARQNRGFTLLFDAYVMSLIESGVAMVRVAKLVGETDTRIARVFDYYLKRAHQKADYRQVTALGMDETSSRKGHTYVTLGVDLQARRVIQVLEGKDKEAVGQLADFLEERGCPSAQITQISIDMSPAFISGVATHFPQADITFDRFHVEKLINQGVDQVRRFEQKECKKLKGHKYTFLKNPEHLTDQKRKELAELITLYPTIGEVYRLKQLFKEFWSITDRSEAILFLEDWYQQAKSCGSALFRKVAQGIQAHRSGVLNYIDSHINNGILEGINSKVQLARRVARGYRNQENFKNMILFLCGKLTFDYP